MKHSARFLATLGVVCGVVVPATPATPRASAAAWVDEPRVIEVVAKRFAFEPAEIQVTVGERVRLVLRTADGLHGIELEKFKIAKEIPRGNQGVTVELTPTETGRFPYLCSEYCGDGARRHEGHACGGRTRCGAAGPSVLGSTYSPEIVRGAIGWA